MLINFERIKHKNIEFLNQSLEAAMSDIISSDRRKQIGGVLWLSNHVEYLVRHLIKNLRKLIKVTTYKNLNGIFFLPFDDEEKGFEKLPLGALIDRLQSFGFPDRTRFVQLLREFNNYRIPIVHNLLDIPPEESRIYKILEIFGYIMEKYSSIADEIKNNWPK